MSMDLTFLGTGSAYPSPHRGASALVLRTDGDCWLFDCGEGTQTQLMKSQLKAGRITKVFITHLHGDHLFGLPGLLCTISLHSCPAPAKPPLLVEVYGPQGLRKFLRVALTLSGSQLMFPYVVHELVPGDDQCPPEGLPDGLEPVHDDDDDDGGGRLHPQEVLGRTFQLDPEQGCYTLLESPQFVVRAFRLFHRLPSFGFVVEERPRPGKLNVQLLKELGIKPGPICGRLKNGESVTLENGVVVSPEDVLEEAVPGRKVCILGDCCSLVGDAGRRLCHGADVLVHEATLEDSLRDKAWEHGHSTPSMAAELAEACQVKQLVLYHFSQRYKPQSLLKEKEDDNVLELKRQAEAALNGREVILAEDFLTIPIPSKRCN
ncbi:zinc phosphodiesterase ELAC protein 1 [Lepisosteus oculatus]|uniref:zinc phosphodiesterase ELAC protein 1 n=1 Tax=Lepisosteus oculatus TaxID=7918 RepID=UPI003712B509